MTASLRIAMLSNLYPPLSTGSAVQCSGLARELVRQGHSVIVFTADVTAGEAAHETTGDGVEVYRMPCLRLPRMPISMNFEWLNSLFRPSNLRLMADVCRKRGIQALHVHNHMFDSAFCGMALSKRLGLPVAVTIHTVIHHANPAFNAILYPLDRFFLGQCIIRRADAVVCPDCTVEKYLSSRFTRTDGTIIPYGISLPPPPDAAEVAALREQWGLAGKRAIVSLGHMHALRNRTELVKALAEIIPRHPDVRLVIVGSRGYKATEDLVRDLGLQDHVIFTGPQPHRLAAAFHSLAYCEANWLDQADMASAGVSCLEAMYYGKAVITACPEDTHEAGGLRNGENICILPRPVVKEDVVNALSHLLDNPAECERLGRQAAAFVSRYFAWDSVTDKHVALYERLIRQNDAS